MPLLVKILCYLISGLFALYGLFGITPEFTGISENPKFDNILHALLVVLWRISFTAVGVALYLLARYYSELSDTQKIILFIVTFHHIIMIFTFGIIKFVGIVTYGGLLKILGFIFLIAELWLWDLIFKPIWKKTKPFANKIGLTPILKTCYTNVYLPFRDYVWNW